MWVDKHTLAQRREGEGEGGDCSLAPAEATPKRFSGPLKREGAPECRPFLCTWGVLCGTSGARREDWGRSIICPAHLPPEASMAAAR